MSEFLTEVKGKKLLDTFLADYKDILNVDDDFLATELSRCVKPNT